MDARDKTANAAVVLSLVLLTCVQGFAEVPRRPETKVILNFGNETAEIVFSSMPYVSEDGVISILPGETLLVEFDVAEGELTNPRYVGEMAHPEKTL